MSRLRKSMSSLGKTFDDSLHEGIGSGKSIAVLTSGGDAQGMNSALFAIVRMGIFCGSTVYGVRWGYQGLVDGGDNIFELTWHSVHNVSHLGGTFIGSARCKDFRTPEGRRKAVLNLVTNGITGLVVIGGDGSLSGADILCKEWSTHTADLYAKNEISKAQFEQYKFFNIVGLVGSIDNDFCGTDMTIGTDSALHRIVECVDSITTTALSHQRAFVLEIMGRNAGFLTLISGLAVGADYVFIPEMPPSDNWETEFTDCIKKNRQNGRLMSIVLVAEGARLRNGNQIKVEKVAESLRKIGLDTRETILGHVQRGGSPSAYDRILATRFGAEAVVTLLSAKPNDPAYVICVKGNSIVRVPLDDCVKKCKEIEEAYKNYDYDRVIELRGLTFKKNLNFFSMFSPAQISFKSDMKLNLAVVHVGAPASGVNACVRSFVRRSIFDGANVYGVSGGFDGFIEGNVKLLAWNEVDDWSSIGGCLLGTTRTSPKKDPKKLAEIYAKYNIKGLLIIGGFEGFSAVKDLKKLAQTHPELNIPTILIAATISNNVPVSEISIGSDTSLNVIVSSCDKMALSAKSTGKRVFIVETMGGKCGYLATIASIVCGAGASYINEEEITIKSLSHDSKNIVDIVDKSGMSLVLRSERAHEIFNLDFISRFYEAEGLDSYRVSNTTLGYIQQGGSPSPFDRISGLRLGARASQKLMMFHLENKPSQFGVLTRGQMGYEIYDVDSINASVDYENRRQVSPWWMRLRPLARVLAKQNACYVSETDDSICVQRKEPTKIH